MGFETSERNFPQPAGLYHEAIPMGFETDNIDMTMKMINHHEAIPMGFETRRFGGLGLGT